MNRILFLLCTVSVAWAGSESSVQKMFFHVYGPTAREREKEYQWASIVFYFAGNPTVEQKIDKGGTEYLFCFSGAQIDSSFEDRCKAIVSEKAPYAVEFIRDDRCKGPGLLIKIDPEEVCIRYQFFDNIRGQKSVDIQIFNKKLIDRASGERRFLLLASDPIQEKKNQLLLLTRVMEGRTWVL